MTNETSINLSPSQQQAYDWLLDTANTGNILHCWCRTGRGRTTVLRKLYRNLGGAFLSVKDFVEAAKTRHPLALEDAIYDVVLEALRENDCVIVDDFHVATNAMTECHFYPRTGYLDSAATTIASFAISADKKLIFGTNSRLANPIRERCFSQRIDNFVPADYEHLCRLFFNGKDIHLDFDKIHRFAPKLNAHQLKLACTWNAKLGKFDTDSFIEYLRSQQLASNVSLGEVAEVDLNDLKGVDEVIRSLEANIAVPLENDQLANELQLQPKRGVLLVGPPGTGKTTVGRALAHRLKGKFFLIDGTFISGTREFYSMVSQIFEAAKDNAPSVIFIDDSDVIFESGQEHGLYRYLLTMLDGLESKSAGRVCVMMTAMDVGNLPPALVRSGRIELWLEMRLPDETARTAILLQQIRSAPKPLNEVDISQIVSLTDGFTGADLKRTIEEGKALYAFDRVSGNTSSAITEYFRSAAEAVRLSKDRYSEAAMRANAAHPTRPAWFNPYSYTEYFEVDNED